jgi:hypothetical protein
MFGLEPNVVSLLGQNIVIYTNAKALRGREARIEQVFITQASHFSAKYRQSFGLHCDGCATIVSAGIKQQHFRRFCSSKEQTHWRGRGTHST